MIGSASSLLPPKQYYLPAHWVTDIRHTTMPMFPPESHESPRTCSPETPFNFMVVERLLEATPTIDNDRLTCMSPVALARSVWLVLIRGGVKR